MTATASKIANQFRPPVSTTPPHVNTTATASTNGTAVQPRAANLLKPREMAEVTDQKIRMRLRRTGAKLPL